MRSKRLAAIGTAIVSALASARAAMARPAVIHDSRHKSLSVIEASRKLLHLRDAAERKGWSPNPDRWPKRYARRYYFLASLIEHHHGPWT